MVSMNMIPAGCISNLTSKTIFSVFYCSGNSLFCYCSENVKSAYKTTALSFDLVSLTKTEFHWPKSKGCYHSSKIQSYRTRTDKRVLITLYRLQKSYDEANAPV